MLLLSLPESPKLSLPTTANEYEINVDVDVDDINQDYLNYWIHVDKVEALDLMRLYWMGTFHLDKLKTYPII